MYDKVKQSADFIKDQIKETPDTAIILGSGLGNLVDSLTDKIIIEYKDIPNFPVVTVKGHGGRLVCGRMKGKKVFAMQGRFHYYEGYSMKEVTYPVFVMKLIGIKNLIVTNSCGGINRDFEPGTLMLITDFINLMPDNPLRGINDERFGPRFPDMSEPYKKDFMKKAGQIADREGFNWKQGVYAGFPGPYYETAAEIRYIEKTGADAVGMSTVPETITANYLGIDVLGIACITNMATGIQKIKHSHDRVVEIANKSSVSLCSWIEKITAEIA